MQKKLLWAGILGALLVFTVPVAVSAQDFSSGTFVAQTGSGRINYVVTIEGKWAGPAGDPKFHTPVYGMYSIVARNESEALAEARKRFKKEYPNYNIIDESVKKK